MALPHMPSYYTTRKNIYEAAIVRRRTKENDFRETWGNTADYFHKENVAAEKKKNWESDRSFQSSMDAYSSGKDKELKALNLKRRKLKLAQMLKEERSNFEAELKGLSPGHHLSIEEMKDKSDGLRSAREVRRQKLAEELLYEQWRSTNPDIRQMETEQHKQHVIDSWRGQVDETNERAAKAREELEAMDRAREEERQAAVRLEEHKQKQKYEDEKQLKAVLKNQMDELRLKELEAAQLKKHEEKLQRSKWELETMETKQKQMETERKKLQFGRVLLRQHAAALKRKSKQIQEELEEDRKFLEALTQQEEKDHEVKSARRDKAQADAAWMKQVIEEQIRVEKAREAELDMLYQDEAARIWEKRENEWAKERQARERLMKEVLEARQEQIELRMETVRQLQEESLERREELLRDMEIANQLSHRDEQNREEEKLARKREIESQMTARQEKKEDMRLKLEEELSSEKKAEENYDELLRKEAENLNINGFQPKVHMRKTAWM